MSALSKSRAVTVRKEEGRRMEEETRKMEAKLEMLRRTMDAADAAPSATKPGSAEAGRWRSGSASKPIRGYVKGVAEAAKSSGKPQQAQQPRAAAAEAAAEGAAAVAGSGASTPNRTLAPQGPRGSSGAVADLLAASGPAGASAGAADATGGDRAASNLQAALNQQCQETQEVERFLSGLKLDRYVSIFLENGFDSMDVVQEMQESHMREIGMAVGHVVKLQKKLQELRPPAPAPAPAPAAAAAAAALSSSARRVSFGAEEAPPAGRAANDTGTAAGAAGKLAEGAFDEAESAASFQEALRAWRGGGTAAKDEPSAAAAAAAAQPAAPKLAPGSFWSSVGGAEVDLVRCSTPVKAPTEGTSHDIETQGDVAPSEEKICCYNCFKQFYKQYAVERNPPAEVPSTPGRLGGAGARRLLCSEACAEKWAVAMEQKAAAQRKRQEKMDALREAHRALEQQSSENPEVVGAVA